MVDQSLLLKSYHVHTAYPPVRSPSIIYSAAPNQTVIDYISRRTKQDAKLSLG